MRTRTDSSGQLRFGILSNSGRILLPFEYDAIAIFSDLDPVTGESLERTIATKDSWEYNLDISAGK